VPLARERGKESELKMTMKTANPRSKQWQSWLVLILRWLLGGLAGIGISAWIYFGLISHTFEMSPVLSVPFAGHIYLFHLDAISFRHVSDFLITFPALIWGLIGGLLASGRRNQIVAGMTMLIIYVVVGYISFFLFIIKIPT